MEFPEAHAKAMDWLGRVEHIADDDEQAHIEEDDFREWALEWIAGSANGATEAAAIAQLALATRDIDFSRWCS
jgi:hypothetical protein